MILLKWLKQLFCIHDWKYHGNPLTQREPWFKCSKCGKEEGM